MPPAAGTSATSPTLSVYVDRNAGLAFAVAAAANVSALILAISLRRFTTEAAVPSILVGTVSSLLLIALSPTLQVDVLGLDAVTVPKH